MLTTPVTYRGGHQEAGFWVFAVLTALVYADMLASAPTAGIVVDGLLGVGSVWMLVRCARASLAVQDAQVEAHGPFRTVTLSAAEIAGFSIGRHRLLGCILLIHRHTGAAVPVFAVQGITGQPRRKTTVRARAIAAELNQHFNTTDPTISGDRTASYPGRRQHPPGIHGS